MKTILSFFILLSCFARASEQTLPFLPPIEEKEISLFEDEINAMERMIDINERRLRSQRDIKEKMKLFRAQKEEFALGNQSGSHAFAMVSNARKILSLIKEDHLTYLFAPDYLEELIFFSSVAAKSTPVRP